MFNRSALFFLILGMGVLFLSFFFSPALAQPPDPSFDPTAVPTEEVNNVTVEIPPPVVVEKDDGGWWPIVAGLSIIATTVIALVSKGGDVHVQTQRLATDERLTAQLQRFNAENVPRAALSEAHDLASGFRDKWLPTIGNMADFAVGITAPLELPPDEDPPPT